MSKGSDNDFPSILLSEQGSAPASPAAGKQRAYIRTSDHTLVTVNSSGTVAPVGGGAAGALVFLAAQTASSSATLDFTSFISATYDTYLFELVDVLPASNAVFMVMRMGTGGGPTFDTGANYGYGMNRANAAGTGGEGNTGATSATLTSTTDLMSNDASYNGVSGFLKLYGPSSATYKKVVGELAGKSTNWAVMSVTGIYLSTTAVTGIRFLFNSGNIASGTIRVYGITKA